MKRAAIYARVSTTDQNPDMQLRELRQLASQRGFTIFREYVDHTSGARSKRPALDELLIDAMRHRFDVVMVWAADRLARNTKHFLELLDQFSTFEIEFVSLRENLDTAGALGRAVLTIVGVVAELERSLIRERVKAGMRRAKLDGRRIGRRPLNVDRESIFRHHTAGATLSQIAKAFQISRTSVRRIIAEQREAVPKGSAQLGLYLVENRPAESAVSAAPEGIR